MLCYNPFALSPVPRIMPHVNAAHAHRTRDRLFGALVALVLTMAAASAEPVKIVAAENTYGDIARQIGGVHVSVSSILANPDQDPHEFEASASVAREIAAAAIVIVNGAGYDPWAERFLSASRSESRAVIVVADLIGKKAGDNPHVWYEPNAIPALADALAHTLSERDPAHDADYGKALAAFRTTLKPLRDKVDALRAKYAGTPVTATEPVFGYMADALGLAMRNARLQLAVMNDTEPSAAAIAAFEADLRTRAVRILFYNSQTGTTLTRRMRELAEREGIPVVGISETEPHGKTYQQWMLSQLDDIGRALGKR
jgi:zinc/manganese transport system substrate-binding protein